MPKCVRFSGRVTDTSQRRLAGVCLELVPIAGSKNGSASLLPLGSREIKTDAEGRFRTEHAAPGRYWAKIYQPSQTGDRCWQQLAANEKLVLTPGQNVEDMALRILPPEDQVISGCVVDGQGQPLSGTVAACYIPHDRSWWNRSDAQGRFVLRSLNGIGRDPLDVYFDDYRTIIRNVPIGTKDLRYVKHERGEISGALLDERGIEPVPEYELKVDRVHLLDCSAIALDPVVKVTRGEAPGGFRISGVPAGRAILEFKVAERRQWAAVEVRPKQETCGQRIRVQPPCVFTGTALFTAAAGQTQNVDIEVVHLETGRGQGWIHSAKSGAFRCETLPAGEYAMRALYGGEVYRTKRVRLEHGQTVTELFAVGGTGTIRGTIRFPEEYGAYANVLLRESGLGFAPNVWGERPSPTEYVLNWTLAKRSDGKYEIRNVPAGTWEVVAFTAASERCVPFARLPHTTHIVTIGDGQTESLNLDLSAP